MEKTKIISILNQKGGVGKTTTTFNIGSELARNGKRVLLIDLDGQSNLTYTSGVEFNENKTIVEVLNEKINFREAIVNIKENLCIIPTKEDLFFQEVELSKNIAIGNRKLSIVLEDLKKDYDYILIDNSPTLNILTYNSLSFSNNVIVVLQSDSIFSLTGLDLTIETIESAKTGFNKDLKIMGLLFNHYDGRTVIGRNILDIINEEYKKYYIFNTKIRKNISISEAQVNKINVFDYAPNSNGANDFSNLAKEILKIS